MAMTLPITIPSPPSASNSPASDGSTSSSNPPRTPVSPGAGQQQAPPPTTANNNSNNNSNAAPKRKPSRRANTAERRATHNAVERQRRETLNGRFLDLAALLPNLSQIRRPSKSSIVNSSIAHIHASRRHRLLAARELRILKLEADALRRELNEWRDRSGIPRVEEPCRGEGFGMILSGELEVLNVPMGGAIEEDDDEFANAQYPQYEEDEGFGQSMDGPEMEDPHLAMVKNASPPAYQGTRPTISVATQQPVMGGPIIASPTAMSFENPAMAGLYSPSDTHIPRGGHVVYHSHGPFPVHQMVPHQVMLENEKVAQWNMMQQQQHPLMRNANPDQVYLTSLARRERSASMSAGSSGSSGSASPVQPFDVPQFEPSFESNFEGQWSHGGGMGGKQQPVFAMMM